MVSNVTFYKIISNQLAKVVLGLKTSNYQKMNSKFQKIREVFSCNKYKKERYHERNSFQRNFQLSFQRNFQQHFQLFMN